MGEIEQYLGRYLSLPPHILSIVTHYILLTWVYDAFNELPYLRFRGDLGSGKTRALIVAGSLCYKAFFASGASTVSPVFHTLDAFRGTLVLDEADFRFSDEKAELSKILNNGNVRGFPVLRTMVTPKKEFDPRAFNVYGPKVIAMRGSFDDRALESRFITIEMVPGPIGKHIPINLPDEQRAEALELRNKLLGFRFARRRDIAVDTSLTDATLTPRGNQIVLPLLSLVEDEKLREEIKSTARTTHLDTLAERAQSPAGHLAAVLAKLVGEDNDAQISVAELTKRFVDDFGGEYERPITNRYIGSLLAPSSRSPCRTNRTARTSYNLTVSASLFLRSSSVWITSE